MLVTVYQNARRHEIGFRPSSLGAATVRMEATAKLICNPICLWEC
jgi:hypothetical protein